MIDDRSSIGVAGEAIGHRPPVLLADFFGHRLGFVVRQSIECSTEQRQQQVVAANGKLRIVAEKASPTTTYRFDGRPAPAPATLPLTTSR